MAKRFRMIRWHRNDPVKVSSPSGDIRLRLAGDGRYYVEKLRADSIVRSPIMVEGAKMVLGMPQADAIAELERVIAAGSYWCEIIPREAPRHGPYEP